MIFFDKPEHVYCMKKIGWLCIALLSTHLAFGQGKKFFEKGTVKLNEFSTQNTKGKGLNEQLSVRLTNGLPLVEVTIGGESYIFLFDSGAPTVISNAIYERLGLKPVHEGKVSDSQNNKSEQVFTVLPDMQLGGLSFTDIGAVVLDLHKSVFGCFKIDGILGANQMAKLFWQVNYNDNSAQATDDLRNFDLTGYDMVLPFETSNQKTPYIKSNIFGKNLSFTFDTGYTGRFKVERKYFQVNKAIDYIEMYGAASVGAYGTAKADIGYLFRTNQLHFDKANLDEERATTGTSNLIGNDFLKDFSYILDWKNNKIYLKRIKKSKIEFKSFGFEYLFEENKPKVVSVFKDQQTLQVGDQILSINAIDLQNLSSEQACHYLLNRIEKDLDTIAIKIQRKDEVLELNLTKNTYFD